MGEYDAETAVGDALRALRRAADKSQAEVAKEIGVSQPVLSLYESGARSVSFDTAHRLTSLYGASLDSLVDGGALEKAKRSIRGED